MCEKPNAVIELRLYDSRKKQHNIKYQNHYLECKFVWHESYYKWTFKTSTSTLGSQKYLRAIADYVLNCFLKAIYTDKK